MLADEQSQSCTQLPNGSYTKDLALVEADLSCVCLIDNSPVSYKVNEGVFPFLLAVPHSALHTIPSLYPSGNVSALCPLAPFISMQITSIYLSTLRIPRSAPSVPRPCFRAAPPFNPNNRLSL